MNIVIGGGGEVGDFLCASFVLQKYDVTVIDKNPNIVSAFQDRYNVAAVVGDLRNADVLLSAGVGKCDFFLSVTDNMSANIISASVAKAIGAKFVIARTDSSTLSRTLLASDFNYQRHFDINMLIAPDTICAAELAKVIRNPGRVAVENIAFNQIEIQRFAVTSRSKLNGLQLKDINVGPNVRFVTVAHEGIDEIPTSDTSIFEKDIVTVAGKHDDLARLLSKLKLQELKSVVSVTVFGASNITESLVCYLKSSKYKIRVIEESLQKCENLAAKFPNVTVVNGDAADVDLLTEEQVEESDYFVACSDDDEKNTMVAIQAKHIGVKCVMLALNDGKYESVLTNIRNTLGIEKIVSKRVATVNELANFVSIKRYRIIAGVSDENNSFIEFKVEKSCKLIGLPVRCLGLPKGCLLLSLMRNFDAKIPSAADVIMEGDIVVAAIKTDAVPCVMKMFSLKA